MMTHEVGQPYAKNTPYSNFQKRHQQNNQSVDQKRLASMKIGMGKEDRLAKREDQVTKTTPHLGERISNIGMTRNTSPKNIDHLPSVNHSVNNSTSLTAKEPSTMKNGIANGA